ncbi:carbohydrate-binding protein, partial [Aquimarina pacifica]|uniref:carbohydrate-binding protein n=1 Tax=Aquimarina pacifica TaxID=1296415 RepID=UPI000472BC8D
NAWWQVDLGSDQSIDEIKVFNRTNNCCTNRLANFTIYVIDSNGTITYSETITDTPTPFVTIDVNGTLGQVVRIESNLTNTLNLAEVEVYGSSLECAEFTTIEAEDFDSMSGIVIESTTDSSGNEHIGFINNGDWSMFSNIDLSCATSITARVSSKNSGGNIEVRLDGVSGELIGTITVPSTNSWTSWTSVTTTINAVHGTHDVYLVYTGGNQYLFNINTIEFSNELAKTNLDFDGIFAAFPNPVTDILTINTNSSKTAKLDIINYAGQNVLSRNIQSETQTIDLSNLSTGIYILKVTDEKQIQTKEIIKQ